MPGERVLKTAATGTLIKTAEPLLWLNGAHAETRYSLQEYFFDCRQRRDSDHAVLQLTLAGAAFYERGGKRTVLTRGMAFIDMIPGNFRYGFAEEGKQPYEQVFISMKGRVVERWVRRIVRSFGNVLNFGPTNSIEPLMLAIAHQHEEKTQRDRYLISAQLYQLFMTVLSVLTQTRLATAPVVAQALEVLDRRGRDPAFNIESWAQELDCSREHLARQFRAGTGVSPLDYLTQHRLRLAARDMRESADKLDLIASRSGFSGANYLCRVFRKQYGITPDQFRQQDWLLA
jgi:AraC-like DNA-binding protein